jgi:hypothetical protein
MGNCTIQGDNTAGAGNYTITPHNSAWLEYQKNCPIRAGVAVASIQGDTAAQDEYPGDGGLHTSKAFTFGTVTGGSSGKRISIDGFLYVGGDLICGTANAQVMYGVLVLSEQSVYTSGKLEVYYDPTISIKTSTQSIQKDSIRKVASQAF